MKQTFTNLNKLLLLLLMTVVSFSASAQCPDDGVLWPVDLTPAGPGETGSFGCVYGGEYYLFTAVAGETYYITSCGSPYDSQITLRDIDGNFLAFDDDSAPCGGGAAAITWPATFSGEVKVQMNEFDCITNSICGDLTVTWLAGGDVFGCTDVDALNYNIDATVDDGSCVYVEGCTDETAINYNPDAIVDDGSCEFPTICDCVGTVHTIGVLTWLGDNAADDGFYSWQGQPVDFNCATWGFDCGDIDPLLTEDPFGVCFGNLPPNNGCGAIDVFGCTDPMANNFNPLATIDDLSCTYGECTMLSIAMEQLPCLWNAGTGGVPGELLPSAAFTLTYEGSCIIDTLYLNVDGTFLSFGLPDGSNTSGSVLSFDGFPVNSTVGAYFLLSNGVVSEPFDFVIGDCTGDALICDCSGAAHTIGVLSWIGDNFADDGAFEWNGQLVDFNCATWGYDCGDVVGAPAEDPNGVCAGNLPPNNGCGATDVFGCTDATANNFNPDATVNDGSCTYDVLGCTDPLANNFNMEANVDDGSCTFGTCSNLMMNAMQMPCTSDVNDVLNPAVDFTFSFDGGCAIDSIVIVLDGVEIPFFVSAPDNVSGSVFGLTGFPANTSYEAYYILADGTESMMFDFTTADCSQDELICDCLGNVHTIGVLSWLGDTFADNSAFTWAGTEVNFNCATWGYDCGDIAGAPAEDPNGVCDGNLPPNNGCAPDVVFGCTDPTANNFDVDATEDDGSCTFDILGCTDPLANNYNPDANVDDASCTFGSCDGLVLTAEQTPCIPDQNGVLTPGMNFTFELNGGCAIDSLVILLDGAATSFNLTAPDNVSGSQFALDGFPTDVTISAYFVLADGTVSPTYDFVVSNCDGDALICDCVGNAHSIGVLTWLSDGFADDGAYVWVDFPVDFNCATWGYDCGDIAGAPVEDPYGVCDGNLPPNNGCAPDDVFGCTDVTANNFNADATVDDGSCTYDVLGCTDPTANNYNPNANVDDGSCAYGACTNLVLTADQTLCTPDANDVLSPGVDFTFSLDGGCTIDSLVIVLNGTAFPFAVVAPDNVSGSVFPIVGFPANSTFTAYFVLADGTVSEIFEYAVGDCSQDPVICDCAGNEHTIGVLSWLGDTFADNAAYTWGGVPVDFNCATWGYDCGDIAGAPAEDPYGVCAGNLPPQNGCGLNVQEYGTSTMMEAYPNPTSGLLTIVSRDGSEAKQIRIFDQSGKQLMNEQRVMVDGVAQQLDLTSLAAGSYHIQIVGQNQVSNVSVIVQK